MTPVGTTGERDGSSPQYDVVGARVRYPEGSTLRSSRRTRLCAPPAASGALASPSGSLIGPRIGSRVARWVGRLFLAAVVGGIAMTGLAPPASAHGQLALSNPAKDSTVSEPLESLELYFTERPISNAYFTVTAPSGVRVDRHWTYGEPKRLDEPVQEYQLVDGTWEPRLFHVGYAAKVPVAYWPEQGTYVARYLTVASDGEEVKGEVRFTYKGKMSAPPKGWKTPTDQPEPALLAAAGGEGAVPQTTAPQSVPETGTVPETGAATSGPQIGPVPQTGSVPETGAATTSPQAAPVPETGVTGVAPKAGTRSDSGTGVMVWLVPAVLVVGVGVMVVRAARRPAPADGSGGRPASGDATARRPSTGAKARKPPAQRTAAPGRKPPAKTTKTTKRR
ncbi:copper resistance protein CopC [Sphaerisporangium sp. NPDC049002]|uniref:copper resistance CopC family protein n=1 Tax=unclassified Sphaerisporangium TaxID=2630420 RepID=UPI0033D918A5